MDYKELLKSAIEIKKNSYSPYSKFKVGAAVLMENGKIYTGVNIENSSFGATNCAERTAIFKAISDDVRNIKAIAIAGDGDDLILPCGICRQVIAEFSDEDTEIVCGKNDREYKVFKVRDLIPKAFELKDKKSNKTGEK